MYEATTDADDTLRFTIGRVDVAPGSPNTVPGKASFTIDMRHPQDAVLEEHEKKLARHRGRARGALPGDDHTRHGGGADRLRLRGDRPGARQGQTELQLSNMDMPSGAGHDAMHIAKALPHRHDLRALRARHQPQRRSRMPTPSDLAAGTRVLIEVLVALANR